MKILVIEDDKGLAELLRESLEESGYQPICVDTFQKAEEVLSKEFTTVSDEDTPFLMIVDYILEDRNAMEWMDELTARSIPIPAFIISTGHGDERVAVNMMMRGARDYLMKDNLFFERFPGVVKRVIRQLESEKTLKLTQQALKNSEESLSDIFKTVQEAIVLITLAGEIILVNNSFEEMFDLTQAQIIGKKLIAVSQEFLSPEISQKVELVLKQLLQGINVTPFEINYREKVLEVKTYINHQTKRLTGVITDITERKHAENALKKSMQRLSVALEAANAGTWEWDPATGENIWSEELWTLYGLHPHTFQPSFEHWAMTIDPVDRELIRLQVAEFVKKEAELYIEYRVRYQDGSIHWMMSRGKPIRAAEGESLRYIGTIIDITQRKQAEAELLKAKEKAEESDRLKTAFLQNISHEIRTPLNGIIGFSSLLREEDIQKEEIREYTEIIQQSGKRLIEIVNNVLDISKIETGQVKVEKKQFSINTLFSEVHNFFLPFTHKKNLRFNYHCGRVQNESVIFSDETKIRQILTNLINNSIKFTLSGGIDFGYEIKDDRICFFVKDTGMGIPAEYFEKIFERFTQVNSSIRNSYEGAGLGLAICKGLVEVLGGKIQLESEVDRGTTFYFSLPYSGSTEVSITQTNERVNPIEKNSATLLIAEDEFISFEYIRRILTGSKIKIIHAENGIQAIQFVKNNPEIDVVLMDIRMPVMDGMEATREIKKIRPDLPVIAQTAYAFSEEKNKILGVGCDDYIAKPMEKNDFLKLLDKFLRI